MPYFLCFGVGDQSRAAVVREVVERPLHQYQHVVLKSHQIEPWLKSMKIPAIDERYVDRGSRESFRGI